MKNIKQYVEGREDIKELYVNEAGAWLRYPRAGFTKKTRDQILGKAKAAEPKTEQADQPAKIETQSQTSKSKK